MITCSSILLEKCHGQWSLVGCRPLGLRRVGHDRARAHTHTHTHTHTQRHIVLSRSVVSDSLPTRWTIALCPWRFSRQEYWSGLPCPLPGDLPNLEIEPKSPSLQADSLRSEQPEKQLYYLRGSPESRFKIVHYFYTFLCLYLHK